MSSADAILTVRSLGIRYGGLQVLSDVSFDVRKGEFVTLLGPSGSGKTSLLRAVAGFIQPSDGDIYLQGSRINEVSAHARDIGMVFQNYALFPHMTVAENLRFGLKMCRVDPIERERRVNDVLEYVRLSGLGGRYPHELSGGQQQRVAIARALAIQPSLLLLDEPMSNLDAKLRTEMRYELLDILGKIGVTAIAVTHNQEEALSMSDRVIVMAGGRVHQIGSPRAIYCNPADQFVADFIGDANILRCRVVGRAEGLVECEAPWGSIIRCSGPACPDGAEVVLLVRPERIEITKSGDHDKDSGSLAGHLAKVSYMGAFNEYRVDLNGHQMLVKIRAGATGEEPAVGDRVAIHWPPDSAVILSG